jgi:hypothetical protein
MQIPIGIWKIGELIKLRQQKQMPILVVDFRKTSDLEVWADRNAPMPSFQLHKLRQYRFSAR